MKISIERVKKKDDGEASKRINFETLKHNEKNRYWAQKYSGELLKFIAIRYVNFIFFPAMGQKLVFKNLWKSLHFGMDLVSVHLHVILHTYEHVKSRKLSQMTESCNPSFSPAGLRRERLWDSG